MNAEIVLPAIVLLALLYVVFPVATAMAVDFRRDRRVPCPVTGGDAAIHVARTGLAEALGIRSLRQVNACSLWPEHGGCPRTCLGLVDGEVRRVVV